MKAVRQTFVVFGKFVLVVAKMGFDVATDDSGVGVLSGTEVVIS